MSIIKHAETRQRFTIAHELGHYSLSENFQGKHEDDDNLLTMEYIRANRINNTINFDAMEVAANNFAAELLMPAEAVKYFIIKKEATNVVDLAKLFYVSAEAMNIRLINLGYING